MTLPDTAVVDVDGTLVDSNYFQVLAWAEAFTATGVSVETWQLHQHMGMGGDRLVTAVAGAEVEERLGDTVRALWRRNYDLLLKYVHPLDGAADLLTALEDHGLSVVIASSGHPRHTRRALRMLGIDDHYPVVDSDDARSTKPAPDLVQTAVAHVDGTDAVMVGDTVWDVEAARRCGFPTIAVCTGGIADATLREAGAVVYPSPRELLEHLDQALASVTQE